MPHALAGALDPDGPYRYARPRFSGPKGSLSEGFGHGAPVRKKAKQGGRFYAPIAVNGKLVFTPAGRAAGEILEITRNVRFPANQGIEWAGEFGKNGIQRSGFVLVDTDNDRVPDTYLPGTSSNFAAGLPSGRQTKIISPCHTVDDEGHCPVPTLD